MTTKLSRSNPLTGRSPLVAVIVSTGDKKLPPVLAEADEKLSGAIRRAQRSGELSSKPGATALFHLPGSKGAARVAAVGVGSGEIRDDWEAAGRAVAQLAGRVKASKATVVLADDADPAGARALLEAVAYGAYRFDRYRTRAEDAPEPVSLTDVSVSGGPLTRDDLTRIDTVMGHVNAARDLSNTPANDLTPPDLARYASDRAKATDRLKCTVMGPKELQKLGAGGILNVGKGSIHDPQLIVLHYTPAEKATDEVLGIVGKAVTFDTGGISIKPAGGMEEMKMDMSGGAATIEAITAIAELGLPVEVIAVVPSAENMPDGSAVKPGDVITAMNGKTIEVINTDAEGRLILADGLTYAARNGATRIIEFSTLTGAIVVSLGEVYAGLFGSEQEWTDAVQDAGERTGDLAWPMPLHERYRPLIESNVADLSNAAKKRQAGSIYAGMFLREFTDGLPFCHVDIAGTGMINGAGTGFGVRMALQVAEDLTASE